MRRDEGVASLRWVACEPRFVFHMMNAFDADGGVAMDVVEYDSAPLFPRADGSPPDPQAQGSRLCRWRVGAAVTREVLDDHPGEFPRIDERRAGLPYRHGFRICPAADGVEAIVHHDVASRARSAFTLAAGERASEAVFVPRAADAPEGEGWLLAVVWRPAQGESLLLVLNAQALDGGPVAEVLLPRRVPFGFHGSWVADA